MYTLLRAQLDWLTNKSISNIIPRCLSPLVELTGDCLVVYLRDA